MNKTNKRQLYEKIMKATAKSVKRHLNEMEEPDELYDEMEEPDELYDEMEEPDELYDENEQSDFYDEMVDIIRRNLEEWVDGDIDEYGGCVFTIADEIDELINK